MNTILTEYIAKSTMELKDRNLCVSFISTIWRDKPALVVFNNVNGTIISTYFEPTLQQGDVEVLEGLIKNFLKL